MPKEILQARIVLIFKKGDSGNFSNYRPISLTNSLYKILAALIKHRMEPILNKKLQKNQFGFRKGKSTSGAIHIIRRIISMGERAGNKTYIASLDLEKALGACNREKRFEVIEK